MKSIFVLFIGMLLTVTCYAASIEDAFKSLENYNYFEAKKLFEKFLKKEFAASNFGLATIYFRTDNPFHNIDSAYACIVRSEKTYGAMKDKQKEKLKKYRFDYAAISSLRQNISTVLFQQAKKSPTEEGFHQFVQKNPWASELPRAIHLRDSIALSIAKSTNKSLSYDAFLKKYPESEYKAEVLNLFYLTQYKENTSSKSITSFLNFEKQFPKNPYITDAQDQVFILSTSSNRVKDYEVFIKNFPTNRNVETAWRKLYQLYMSDYSLKRLDKFQQEYPQYPFKEELEKDKQMGIQILVPYKQDAKYGWMDIHGKIAIPAQYTSVGFFKEGLAWVEKGGKYGFVNKANELIIPFQFSSCNDFEKGRAIVELDSVYGIIDRSGAFIVNPVYKDLGQYSDGLVYAMKDSLYGYLDEMGYQRIPEQFEEAFSFNNGTAKIMIEGMEAYIDVYGTYKFRPLFETVSLLSDSLALVENDEGELSLYAADGKPISSLPLEYVGKMVNNRALFISNGKIGYLNSKGIVAINPVYDNFINVKSEGEFVGNYAKVSKANKFGICDRNGKTLIPLSYSKLGDVSTLIAFEKAGKWGYIDLANRVIIQPTYEFAESFANGLGIVQDLTLKGAINSKGQLVIPIEFTKVKALDANLFQVTMGALSGIYTQKGELVVPVEYANIRKVQDDFYLLSKGQELHYFYVPENKLIIPQL